MTIRGLVPFLALFASGASAQLADPPPLLPATQAGAIAGEVSGSAALRTVQALSLHHRMRGSQGYRAAAETIRDRLREYGLAEVEILSLPADGRRFYGTQRSRPAWNARFAELWEQSRDGESWRDSARIASWAEQPISLAQDSVDGRAEAELVDIGAGTSPADYEGKNVRGRLVLTSSQPEAVQDLAIGTHGAAGIGRKLSHSGHLHCGLAGWYIHTQRDVPGNLDPTKMRRAAFIAAASGYHLATDDRIDAPALPESSGAPSGAIYRRIRRDGPMDGFGYSWLDDQLARNGLARPRLLGREAPRNRASFAYEALNLIDGRRSTGEVRNILGATIGDVPVEEVAEYFDTLARLRVLEAVRP